jgi:hypothetical protein
MSNSLTAVGKCPRKARDSELTGACIKPALPGGGPLGREPAQLCIVLGGLLEVQLPLTHLRRFNHDLSKVAVGLQSADIRVGRFKPGAETLTARTCLISSVNSFEVR